MKKSLSYVRIYTGKTVNPNNPKDEEKAGSIRQKTAKELMHMSMQDEFVFTLPKVEGPGGDLYASPKAYFNGSADMWHANMVMGFTVVQHEALVDIPHVHHAVEEIYMFSGKDVAKFFDFDAEIEIWIGENPDRMEKYVITKPTLVRIPARMWHGPINYKRVGKPVAFSAVYMNGERSKITRRVNDDGTVEFPYVGSSLKRCVLDRTKSCSNCGRCLKVSKENGTPHPRINFALEWAKEIAESEPAPHSGKYDGLFFEYPVEYHNYGDTYANPRGKFRGILQLPEVNFFGGFSVVMAPHHMEVPHCHHARDEYLWFSGSDLSDPFGSFDAEITVEMGWDPDHMETVTITEPSVIRVPPNMWHCPINFKRIDKPMAFFPFYGDGDWSKIVRKQTADGDYEYLFEAASLRKCVYNHDKLCMYCGKCAKDDSVPSFGIFPYEKKK